MKRKMSAMQKTGLLALALLASLLVAAQWGRTARLTLINQSGLTVWVRLTSTSQGEDQHTYSFKVFEDSTKSFDVVRDQYSISVSYVELWDPVYGYDCSTNNGSVLMSHNQRLTLNPCTYTTPIAGNEKSGRRGGGGRHKIDVP